MNFVDLDEDVILSILSASDIPTVLSTARTCRRFCALINSSKFLWLALISEVQCRASLGAPDLLLQSLSAKSLVNLLKRALHGPKTWEVSPHAHYKPNTWTMPAPTSNRRIILRPSSHNYVGASLISGGQYLLLRAVTIECWEISQNRLVWEFRPHGNYGQSPTDRIGGLCCGEEVFKPGEMVHLMVCFAIPVISKQIIEVLQLNLESGRSELLHSMETSRRPTPYTFLRPRLCGDWAMVYLNFAGIVFLLNWRNGHHVQIRTGPALVDATLVPGHLVALVAAAAPTTYTRLKIWDVSCFDWQSGPAVSNEFIQDPCPLIWENIILPGGNIPRQLRIDAHAHPLYNDTYVLWAYVASPIPRVVGGPTLPSLALRYLLRLNALNPSPAGPEGGSSLQQGDLKLMNSSGLHQGHSGLGWCGISFSGHTLAKVIQGQRQINSIVTLNDLTDPTSFSSGVVEFPTAYHLTPYNGALTYIQDGEVVVEYYD